MSEPLTKDQILDLTKKEHETLLNAISALSPDDMHKIGVTDVWTVKDLLAHLTAWEQMFLGSYSAGKRGEKVHAPGPGPNESWASIHIINARILEQHRNDSLDAVMQAFNAFYEQILSAIQSMTEDEINIVGRYAWAGCTAVGGYIRASR